MINCQHRWLYEAPAGGSCVYGFCRLCYEERWNPVWLPQYDKLRRTIKDEWYLPEKY